MLLPPVVHCRADNKHTRPRFKTSFVCVSRFGRKLDNGGVYKYVSRQRRGDKQAMADEYLLPRQHQYHRYLWTLLAFSAGGRIPGIFLVIRCLLHVDTGTQLHGMVQRPGPGGNDE